MSREHMPIPVETARTIAHQFRKSMVVILSYDPAWTITHVTTYGVSPGEKEMAADVGDRCAKLICGDGFQKRASYEDYRFLDQGKRAQRLEQLARAATAARHAISSVIACREGITDEALQAAANALDAAIREATQPEATP